MRIVRFLDRNKSPEYGVLDEGTPGVVRVLLGDPFRGIKLGGGEAYQRMLAPLAPPLIYALGLNYRDHAGETGVALPDRPVVFLKAPTSVVGPGDAVLLPKAGPGEVDYEGELAVVIGKRGKNIPVDQALGHVFGYTCACDVTARDWQNRLQKKQWARGKSFDTFCPLGPWIVTADEIRDPGKLHLVTRLNGQVVQDAPTADLIFSVPEIIADLSRSLTLLPGTVILTGTPAGVGFTRQPPLFLKAGDRVEVEISSIGTLANHVELE